MTAFLMVKPDGVERGLLPFIRTALRAQGVAIQQEKNVEFRPGDVSLLWPRIQISTHPLTTELLTRYLMSAPSRLLLMDAPHALEAAQKVKRTMRQRFGNRLFGNLVHVADLPNEMDRELRVLLTPAGLRSADLRAAPTDLAAAAGTQITISQRQAEAACEDLWQELSDGVFEIRSVAPLATESDDWQVILHDDDINTPDSFVEGLLAVVPSLSLAIALRLVIQLDFTNAAPIITCTKDSYAAISARLHAQGIKNLSRAPLVRAGDERILCSFRDIPSLNRLSGARVSN